MSIQFDENDWFGKIVSMYSTSRIVRDSIKYLNITCSYNIAKLSRITREINKHRIILPPGNINDSFMLNFEKVYSEFCEREKLRFIFKFFHPECRYVIEECFIDEKPLTNMDQAIIIELLIEQRLLIEDTSKLWNNTIKSFGGPEICSTLQDIIDMEMPLKELSRFIEEADMLQEAM